MIRWKIHWPGGNGNEVGKDSREKEEMRWRLSVDCFEFRRRQCRRQNSSWAGCGVGRGNCFHFADILGCHSSVCRTS